MSEKEQMLAAISQFQVEIARCAQYASLIDEKTDNLFSLADSLIGVANSLSLVWEHINNSVEDSKLIASYQGA